MTSEAKDDFSQIEAWLPRQTKEDLAELVLSMVRKYENAAADLRLRINVEDKNTVWLADLIRSEAAELMAQNKRWKPADYSDSRYRQYSCDEDDDLESEVPDYSKFLELAEKALPLGLADELLGVMDMVFDSILENDEDFNDSLYLAAESLYPMVIRALEASSLAEDRKILLAADRMLSMSWDSDHLIDIFRSAGHSPEGWSKAADEFLVRVSETPADDEFSDRGENCDFAVIALERSGRTAEIIPLLTNEAGITKSYLRLVKHLNGAGLAAEALKQAEKGILAVFRDQEWTAEELRRLRAEIWTEKQEWVPVLGYYICNTAEYPSSSELEDELYGPIKETAEHLKRWPEVRTGFLEFLETGTLPWGQAGGAWLKPGRAELAGRKFRDAKFPQFESLVRIAVHENQPAEILKRYDRLLEDRAETKWEYHRPFFVSKLDLKVAQAVINFAPGRTLGIWKKAAETAIAETQREGYQRAGSFLADIRDLMIKLKKDKEWLEYLAGLRSVHKRKRVLLEELDKL